MSKKIRDVITAHFSFPHVTIRWFLGTMFTLLLVPIVMSLETDRVVGGKPQGRVLVRGFKEKVWRVRALPCWVISFPFYMPFPRLGRMYYPDGRKSPRRGVNSLGLINWCGS